MKTTLKNSTFLKRALLLMSAGLLTHAGAMAYDFEVDGLYYNITSDTEAAITYYYKYSSTLSGKLTIPETVTFDGTTYSVASIDVIAFWECPMITEVTIPESVTSIGERVFYGCTALTSVTIGNGMTKIGERAFYRCTALTSINLSEDNENFCSVDGVLYTKDMTELMCYPEGKQDESFEIPSSVTSIEDYAFDYCTALTSVTLGSNLTSIGSYAFGHCTELAEIYSLNPTPPTLNSSNVFNRVVREFSVLYVPEGSYEAYATADYWSEFFNIVEVDFGGIDEITSDPDSAVESARYDINGRQLSAPQQGINIVRYSDGSTEKVIVK